MKSNVSKTPALQTSGVASLLGMVLAALMMAVCVNANADELEDQINEARRQLDEAAQKLAELHKQQFSGEILHRGAMLGVMLGDVQPDDERHGVELYGVTPGGGAQAAGLQAGDVITSIGAMSLVDVDEPMQKLMEHMRSIEPGEVVVVEYLRDADNATAAITTQARYAGMAKFISGHDFDIDVDFDFKLDDIAQDVNVFALAPEIHTSVQGGGEFIHGRGDMTRRAGDFIGRRGNLMPVEGDLARYFSVDSGVLVVSPPAQDSQLRGGDIIVAVGEHTVDDVPHAQRQLAAIEGSAEVAIMRDGLPATVVVNAGEFAMHDIKVITIQHGANN